MPLLILGILFTAVCWHFAWSNIGLLSEYSFFPLWVGYILLVNGLSEVMAGTSLMRRMRWSFLWLFIVSIPMWWFFEYMNSIIQNWHYLFARPVSILHYEIEASIDFSTERTGQGLWKGSYVEPWLMHPRKWKAVRLFGRCKCPSLMRSQPGANVRWPITALGQVALARFGRLTLPIIPNHLTAQWE